MPLGDPEWLLVTLLWKETQDIGLDLIGKAEGRSWVNESFSPFASPRSSLQAPQNPS